MLGEGRGEGRGPRPGVGPRFQAGRVSAALWPSHAERAMSWAEEGGQRHGLDGCGGKGRKTVFRLEGRLPLSLSLPSGFRAPIH